MKALYTPDNGNITLVLDSEEIRHYSHTMDKVITCNVLTKTKATNYISEMKFVIVATEKNTGCDSLDCEWGKIPDEEQQAPTQISVTPRFIKLLQERQTNAHEFVHVFLDNESMNDLLTGWESIALHKLRKAS